jgi:hypothetical protein
MVQGAVFKKRNIKERTLVTFLKKRNEKTHPFVSITFQSQVQQFKSKNKKEKEH